LFNVRLKIKPGSAVYVALPWLLLSTLIWIAPALVVIGLLLDAPGYFVAAAFLLLVVVVALQFSDRQKSIQSRLLRTVTEYPQVGFFGAAAVLLMAGGVYQENALTSIAIAFLITSVLAAVGLNITRQTFLISKEKSSLGTYQVRTTQRRDFPKSDKKVSIVMPCFNEERFLRDAIESVQAQTHTNWELIIVDDCSTDNSTLIAAEAAINDKRIQVIRLRRNSGLPSARNTGFSFAESPFVVFLDSDDALLPTALAGRLALAQVNDDVWGVAFRNRLVSEDFDWRTLNTSSSSHTARTTQIDLVTTIGNSPFGIHETMIRSQRVRQLGGFSEEMRGGSEDAHFWLRSLRSGATYVRREAVDCIYRQKSGSMVADNIVRQATNTIGVMEASWIGSTNPDLNVHLSDSSTGELLFLSRIQVRLFRFLGMTYFGSNLEVRKEIESMLTEYLPIIIQPKQVMHELRAGVKRNLQREPGINVSEEIEKLSDEFEKVIEKWIDPRYSELSPRKSFPKNAVLVENAAQFVELDKSLSSVSDELLPALIIADSLDAPQGAWDAMEASGRPYVVRSIPSFSLEGAEYLQLFIPSPMSWIGNEVALLYANTKTSLRSWALPWSSKIEVNDDDFIADRVSIFNADAEFLNTDQLKLSLTTHATVERVELERLAWPTANTVDSGGARGDYKGLIRPDFSKLHELKNKHKGQRCIIIGNGPSLNQTDFNLLKEQTTFGVNGIFYADDRLPQPLSYYVVEDTKVFEENTEAILEYGRGCGEIILPTLYKENVPNPDEVTFFRMNGGFYRKQDPNFCRPRFSTDAAEVLYCGQSVTYINLQLAYWMGFTEVGLIGMDFSYTLPPGTVVKGNLYESQEDDPNHFDPRYFGAGKTWKNPYLNRVAANYELAKAMYEADGRIIYNCTVGGKLEVFERLDLSEFVKEAG
jgi:hypothetical protein